MQLQKTNKARAELTPGVRTLGQRERTLLLLADGSRSTDDLRSLFDGEGEQLALRLMQEGYLEKRVQANRFATSTPVLKPASQASPPALTPLQSNSVDAMCVDSFDGKRSLATTRMFLFDICERMFARRDPAMAERFRHGLRQAKERRGMLEVSRDMIEEIEKAAGSDRADSISERLAMLLPPETAEA